jgi:hypothetical protein
MKQAAFSYSLKMWLGSVITTPLALVLFIFLTHHDFFAYYSPVSPLPVALPYTIAHSTVLCLLIFALLPAMVRQRWNVKQVKTSIVLLALVLWIVSFLALANHYKLYTYEIINFTVIKHPLKDFPQEILFVDDVIWIWFIVTAGFIGTSRLGIKNEGNDMDD